MGEPAYKRWYYTSRWRKLRADQIHREPLCAMCLPRVVEAKVCDHVEPHKGDEAKFWAGPFQSLCFTCHNSSKQRMERGNRPPKRWTGSDGWPE